MKVAILGAYGQTGRVLAEALVKNSSVNMILVGRSMEKLQRLARKLGDQERIEVAKLDLDDSEGFKKAIGDAHLVANCIGPYLEWGFDIAG